MLDHMTEVEDREQADVAGARCFKSIQLPPAASTSLLQSGTVLYA